jgi:hypothetical protein
MDPNAALAEIRRLIDNLKFQIEPDTGLVDLDDASELIDRFEGLDGWLSKGGFLPTDWRH